MSVASEGLPRAHRLPSCACALNVLVAGENAARDSKDANELGLGIPDTEMFDLVRVPRAISRLDRRVA
jgi:hypothetical protein